MDHLYGNAHQLAGAGFAGLAPNAMGSSRPHRPILAPSKRPGNSASPRNGALCSRKKKSRSLPLLWTHLPSRGGHDGYEDAEAGMEATVGEVSVTAEASSARGWRWTSFVSRRRGRGNHRKGKEGGTRREEKEGGTRA